MSKTIDKNFKSRYSGITQFIGDYGDFDNLKIGMWSIFLFEGSNEMQFQAFFEGRELENKKQRVFLQYDFEIKKGNFGKKRILVGEYLFPISGKIREEDLDNCFIRHYPVNGEKL